MAHKKDVRYWQISDIILNQALRVVPVGGNIIDIGCGCGELVLRIHAMGYDVHGVDASDTAINNACLCGTNGIFRCVDIEKEEILERYSLVFLNLVLPFLKNKDYVLRKIRGSCDHLVLVVPVLLDRIAHSDKSRRIGMLQSEIDSLLIGANFFKREILFRCPDKSDREIAVYLLS